MLVMALLIPLLFGLLGLYSVIFVTRISVLEPLCVSMLE